MAYLENRHWISVVLCLFIRSLGGNGAKQRGGRKTILKGFQRNSGSLKGSWGNTVSYLYCCVGETSFSYRAWRSYFFRLPNLHPSSIALIVGGFGTCPYVYIDIDILLYSTDWRPVCLGGGSIWVVLISQSHGDSPWVQKPLPVLFFFHAGHEGEQRKPLPWSK